jgi:hypothetical protein
MKSKKLVSFLLLTVENVKLEDAMNLMTVNLLGVRPGISNTKAASPSLYYLLVRPERLVQGVPFHVKHIS